jgi:AcrR family transcriptional regulator
MSNSETSDTSSHAKSDHASAKPRRGAVRKPAAVTPGSVDVQPPRESEVPRGARAAATYERLVATAGELLGELGFEKLTTNAIAARANVSPPALYRYFNDKYEILAVLARRLLKRQFDAYAIWMFQGGAWDDREQAEHRLADWFRIAADIVATEPGGVWTLRALRALPNLAHIRMESQRLFADYICDFYRRVRPDIDPVQLWINVRVRVEFGFVVDELALEEDRASHEDLFRHAAQIMGRLEDAFPVKSG